MMPRVLSTAFLLVTAWAAAAPPLSAQVTLVRTGEHDDFTRIVIDFTNRPEWRLGRVGEGYELRVVSDTLSYDLSDAFRRIGGSRLVSLTDAGGGTLAIRTGCECTLAVEELANQGLVIDVRDGTSGEPNRFESRLDPATGAGATASGSPKRRAPVATIPVIVQAEREPLRLGPLAEVPGTGLPDAAALLRMNETRAELLQQLARSASQGLVDLGGPIRDRARAPSETAEKTDGSDAAKMAEPEPKEDNSNIRIETRIDRDLNARRTGVKRIQERPCLAPELVDVGVWSTPETVTVGLGAARARLVDSHDRPDPDAYAAMIQKLIYMSFGVEAHAVLRGAPEGIQNVDLLAELATIVDGGHPPAGGILETQLTCDSAGAMWAMLAPDTLPILADVNKQAVLRTLSALPPHLRQLLGPRLADRFMDRGDRESALAIRNAMTRGAHPSGPALTMLSAKLDLDTGNRRGAERALSEVSASRTDAAADALVKLIEARIGEGAPVEPDLIEHASALAFEYDGSPPTHALSSVIVRAMIHEGRIEEALAQTAEFRRRRALTPEQATAYRAQALERLAREAEADVFLPLALEEIAKAPLADPARLPVADRLARMKLSAPARNALGVSAKIPGLQERHILARIALLEGRPGIAESYLTGLSDQISTDLRAQAADAVVVPSEIQTQAIGSAETPRASETPVPQAPAGVLAQNRNLIDASRAMREGLSALLTNGE